MASFSTFLANELLDHILRNEAYAPPSSLWIALFTANNGLETNVQTGEVSGGSYARLEFGGASGRNFPVASGSQTANNADWSWAAATANWGTVTHMAICTASTGGQVLYWKQLISSRTVNSGDTARFLSGELIVQHL
jgi:hypothetical protein